MARDRHDDDAVRITTAAASRNQDIATRQRRYLVSMSLRSICFMGAIVAFLVHVAWLWPILIAGALVLPYVAVVLANAAHIGGDGFDLVDHGAGRSQLNPGRDAGPRTR